LAFLIPIALNIAVSCAAEYLLPVAVAGLQQYAGGTFAAAALTGVVNGYNGNYTSSAFSGDLGLGIAEKAGMAIGTLLSVNPSKVTVNTVTSVAKNRVIGGALKKASSEGLELLGKCVAKTGRGSAKQAADKAFKVATQKGIAKGVKGEINKMPLQSRRLNPFKGKNFEEIDCLLKRKGFYTKGLDPLNGKGSYFHPKTNRKYYLDHAGRIYRKGIKELPHVDVHYKFPVNGIKKKRFSLGESLYE